MLETNSFFSCTRPFTEIKKKEKDPASKEILDGF